MNNFDTKPEMEKLHNEYATDVITEDELEDEIELWLRVEECEFCFGKQLCTIHFGQMVGR